MQSRFKLGSGVIVLFSGSSANSQPTTTGSSAPASAPDPVHATVIGDPTWFVAGLATGIVIGAIGARVFGIASTSRQR